MALGVPIRCVRGILLTFTLLMAASGTQAAPNDKPAAEVLFQDGVRLMRENRLDVACQKLDASHKLDSAVGTLLRLGHCYEQAGRTASAWATFQEAVSLAQLHGQAERREIAEARAAALEPKLCKLGIVIAEQAASSGLKVLRNGVVVPRALWGLALPVDPGEHSIEVRAPGYRPFRTAMKVDEPGVSRTLPVPPLEPLPTRAQRAQKPSLLPAAALQGDAHQSPAADPGRPQENWAFIVGGVGAAAIATGAVLAVVAYTRNQDSLEACLPEDPSACTPEGKRLRDGALDYAFGSTIAFVAGGALLTGGVVLYATRPSVQTEARNVELRVAPSAVTLRGAF
jgi:hypothetical protein